MPDLTARQTRFVEEYLVDLNGKQAAIRAGYSENSAEAEASRLLRNVKVSAAVAVALEARAKKTGIDAEWLLRRLVDEATADIADLFDDDGNLKPLKAWPKIWRTGLVAGVEFETITVKGKKTGTIGKVKLSDRAKRLDMIGKHVDVQAFRERVEVTGKDGKDLVPEKDGRTLAREIAFALAAGLQGGKE
ncbi:terminase small subunit [Mesorhizobium sp. LNJC405B00]|uniref:terminase small subunit n=1 Tax=Mesorhizobium sp. LNJC405B00 TaxID=1287281 RepID=UPI0003CF19A8|nr:terminase small subunit [Mesorhizobium sp. LNJC405B00]ESY02288.1 terminase [Mesorhizobium sp. LNJC405B00]